MLEAITIVANLYRDKKEPIYVDCMTHSDISCLNIKCNCVAHFIKQLMSTSGRRVLSLTKKSMHRGTLVIYKGSKCSKQQVQNMANIKNSKLEPKTLLFDFFKVKFRSVIKRIQQS